MINNKKNTYCNNCGRVGHLFHQCKIPITSLGVIAFRKNKENVEVLLIRRKDSLAFVDFMRGKYNLEDKNYVIKLFEKMTVSERKFIFDNEFEVLWSHLWGTNITNQYKSEEKNSKHKFKQLKSGYIINNEKYNLEDILNLCTQNYEEPEWGFPKGRRNYQERDIICGLREFEEETGYDKNELTNITNILPLEETFTGSNYKSYKHKYFLGYINNTNEPTKQFQLFEISKIEWVSLDKAHNYIRDYNIEKKNILLQLNNLLKTYKLYI
tara:strand:+ start:2385 stop:3188 length:804 start_codon:yes stop_codon:yes gene_type:complete